MEPGAIGFHPRFHDAVMSRHASGYSFIEVVFTLGIVATLAAAAMANTLAGLDEYRASAAARFVSTRLARARMEAIARSAAVGVRFASTPQGVAYGIFADGNGNGVRSSDIQSGVDAVVMPPERLPDQFPGVDFGVLPGLPAVDSGAPPDDDPIHVGSSNIVTFTASGTASTGSLYIRGKGPIQWVVRIYGETGKTRMLKFDARQSRWSLP